MHPELIALSIGQSEIWYGQKLVPGESAYHIWGYVEISGKIDCTVLARATRDAVAQADSLHYRFVDTDAGPRQSLLPFSSVEPEVLDLSAGPDARAEALAWMRTAADVPFNLTTGPLHRFTVLKIADDCVFFFGVFHHLVTDFIGSALLLRRIAEHYTDALQPAGAQRPQLTPWSALLEEERAYLASPQCQRDRAYWLEQLHDRAETVTLCGQAPAWPSAALDSYHHISAATFRELEALGAACKAGAVAVLYAAIALYLARMTGQCDLVLGMPMSARISGRSRHSTGFLANVLPLRLKVALERSFTQLVQQAAARLREGFRHQRYPSGALRADLDLAANEPGVCGPTLNFIPGGQSLNYAGQAGRLIIFTNSRSVDDLRFTVYRGDDGEQAMFLVSANADHYDPGSVEVHARNILQLLDTAVAQPERPSGLIEIVSGAQRQRLFEFSNGPSWAPSAPGVVELFAAQVRRSPQAVAVVHGERSLTYAALAAEADQLAQRLRQNGVGPGQLVGLWADRSLEMLIGVLGIWKAGGAYLPLDPLYPPQRLQMMLADARPLLLLGAIDAPAEVAPGTARLNITAHASDKCDAAASTARHMPPLASHPAYVIYTSGSTGKPKGVLVTHAGLSALAAAQIERFQVTPHSRVLQFASLNFDASVSEVLMALVSGAALVLASPEELSGAALQGLLVRQGITHATLPPAVLATLTPSPELVLKCLVVAGEACAPALIAQWSSGVRMINAYGPTEVSVCASMSGPLQAGQPAPIGTPIVGARLYVLDAALEPAAIGVEGELYIAGVGLARGYLNRPGLTAERFVADPYGEPGSRMYRSGDLARWRADGQLEYRGRADQQVKVRGHRIELAEIEAQLTAQQSVEQAAVAVREDPVAGKLLVAYLVARTGQKLDADELRQALAARLPQYMIPSTFTLLDALPLTPSGKVDRRALQSLKAAAEAEPFEPPRTPTEVRLAGIWREVLKRAQVGRTEDFFRSGGQSLLALQVVARVRESFGFELPLKTVFDSPSLAAMATAIDQALDGALNSAAAAIPTGPDDDAAPLSHSQERLWLIQSLDPQTSAYNMAGALWLRGSLDVAALSGSVDELVARHPVLRSRIEVANDTPQQMLRPAESGMLQVIDLRGHAAAEAEALRQASAESRGVFDLERDPVLRMRLYRTAADTFLLAIIMHHVAGDQWSMGVFGRELAALYNGRVAQVPAQLPPLALSYRDFARWQRSDAFTARFEPQLKFWRRQLADVPALDLPIDHARPKVWTTYGATIRRALPAALLSEIEALARAARATAFMTLFAGFAALLQRLSGQTDLAIGVPVANRTHSATEGIIGAFLNTLVLRTDLSGDPQFDQLLERVRVVSLAAFQNQDVSFDRLVQELGQRGQRNRAPLVQVMFNVANAPMGRLGLSGLTSEALLLDRGGAQFELSFSIDTEATRMLSVEYNTDLFAAATIERLIGQYFAILEAVVAAPQVRLSKLPLLPAADAAQLRAWNAASQTPPITLTLPQLFEAQVTRSPAAAAISFDGTVVSYGELNAQANAIARLLRAAGVGRGARVGVCMARSPLMVAALLAVQKSAAAYVPLDPDFPAQRLQFMLSDSGASALLTSGSPPKGLEVPAGIAVLDLTGVPQLPAPAVADDPGDGPAAADLVYVLYTSGSTGRPKGVAVPHGALANFLVSMRERPGLAATDVLAAVTTISFDIAGLELYLPLIVGARIELVSKQVSTNAEMLARLLDSSGATVLQATPATWRLLLEADWHPARPLRALCGGEALSRTLAEEILGRVAQLWNLYGPTETTIWSTLERIERDGAPISIGRPIANTQVHILDQAGQPVPIGVVGEICIGGAGVAAGYLGRPDLTAERFVADKLAVAADQRLYRTGDLGHWSAEGKLYHLGRSDHQIKIRGYRIELGEIENALGAHPAVQQAIAAVQEARADDLRLIAYVRLRDGQDATGAELKRELRLQLPDYMVPSMIVLVDAMPLTPNGKVDRAALPNPFAATPVEVTVQELPTTQMEQAIAQVWKSVLNIERVGPLDNFFELGGYSLLSLRVVKLIEKRTGRQMDPRALFFQNLREIAGSLESQDAPVRALAR